MPHDHEQSNTAAASTPMYRLRNFALLSVIAVPLALTSCSSDSQSASSTTTTTSSAAAADSSAGDTSSTDETTTTTSTSASGVTKVNANTASESEIASALDSAGVPNASRWAREVAEYRPYSDDDWQHLREELGKYNIDEPTFALIISALTI